MVERRPYRAEHVEPLWDRIDRNRRKLAFFVALFVAAWTLAAEVIVVLPVSVVVSLPSSRQPAASLAWGRHFWSAMAIGAGIALAAGIVWVTYALRRRDAQLLVRLGAARVPLGELPDTKRVLHEMSIAVGLEHPPPLYLLDTTSVNAFVLGRKPESLAIGMTGGMIKLLTVDEQRAVFANLLARFRDGDTVVATAAAALMSPVWVMRNRDLRPDEEDVFLEAAESERDSGAANDARNPILLVLPFYMVAVVVTEFLYFGQMQQQILTAEAADAKGMLLLKDPRCMLTALEHALPEDNVVVRAGAALAPLFFCWTGDALMGEEDPEFRRVGRMREALGVDGMAEIADADLAEYLPPRAARFEETPAPQPEQAIPLVIDTSIEAPDTPSADENAPLG
jgi:Zn-dependent protease with chaperone function